MSETTALQDSLQQLLDQATSSKHRAPERSKTAVPGAAAIIARDGEIVARAFSGVASLISPDGKPVHEDTREAVTQEHLWDIASITKTIVTVAALNQVDKGTLNLDDPVTTYLTDFGDAGEGHEHHPARHQVTVRQLLTHTSGLPATCQPWSVRGTRAQRAAYVLSRPLTHTPGTGHAYSCVGFMTLGLILERITGRPLPDVVAESVTGPLGMTSTTYQPPSGHPVIATEVQNELGRGLVRGEVHDEAAWSLGGAGNAGLFSTVDDLLRFGEEVRSGRRGVLSEESRASLFRGTLDSTVIEQCGYNQAIGFRLGQQSLMATNDQRVLGHSGFTGTALVIDPVQASVTVLLTNAVHPERNATNANELRQAVATLARRGAVGSS